MVCSFPDAGLRQGAEVYLRHVVGRRGSDPDLVRNIQDALDRFDGANSRDTAAPSISTSQQILQRPARGGRAECDCDDYELPNYHHVHDVEELPRERRTDHHIVVHGFAVRLSGSIDTCWVFFHHLEPALAFGRAGRMSSVDIRTQAMAGRCQRGFLTLSPHLTSPAIPRPPRPCASCRRCWSGRPQHGAHRAAFAARGRVPRPGAGRGPRCTSRTPHWHGNRGGAA